MNIHFFESMNDRDELREEAELRALMARVPAESGPSDAYWDTYATRVMARIARDERAPARPRWSVLWKPILSMASIGIAVAAFVMLHPVEPTLDQTVASLGTEEVRAVGQSDASIVPVSAIDQSDAAELTSAAGKNVDVDAVLAFDNADPDQITAMLHTAQYAPDAEGLDELSEDDANAVILNLRTSL